MVRINQVRERKHVHEHLRGRREAAGVIQADGTAVGTHAIDELEVGNVIHHNAVLLGQRCLFFIRKLGDEAVHHVVLVHGDEAHAPACHAVELGERVDQDGVVRNAAVHAAETLHEGAVHVVGEDDQVGVLLHDLGEAVDGRIGERVACGV